MGGRTIFCVYGIYIYMCMLKFVCGEGVSDIDFHY